VPAATSRRLLSARQSNSKKVLRSLSNTVFDPTPYVGGVEMTLTTVKPGSAPGKLVECPAGSGVSYSAKTSYQARECVTCKQLYALGEKDSTASGSYSKFLAG